MVLEQLSILQIINELNELAAPIITSSLLPDSVHLLANWGSFVLPSEVFIGDATGTDEDDDPVVFGKIDMYPKAIWDDEYKGQKQTVLTRCEVCAQEAVKVA